MSGKLLDPMDRYKVIQKMEEMKPQGGCSFHRVGPMLKGLEKKLPCFAYYPQLEEKNGMQFAVFSDRAYQIIAGTYYRCRTLGNKIFPRFEYKKS